MTTTAPALTARQISAAIYAHFYRQSWAVLFEVPSTPEREIYEALQLLPLESPDIITAAVEEAKQRRIDALCLRSSRTHGSSGMDTLALEFKVTVEDLRNDVRSPDKQGPWRQLARRHAYVIPAGLADPDEIPAASGVLTVTPQGPGVAHWLVEWARPAPGAPVTPELPHYLMFHLASRASGAEARIHGYQPRGHPSMSDDPDDLRAEIERLRLVLGGAERRAETERGKHLFYREAFGAARGLPCQFCGEEVRPRRGATYALSDTEWRHRRLAADEPCQEKRTHLAEANARHEWQHTPYDARAWHSSRGHSHPEGEMWRALMHPLKVMPAWDDTEPDPEGDADAGNP